jgi:hypothetical protein
MNCRVLSLLIPFCFILNGCVIIPTPEHGGPERMALLEKEPFAFFVPAKTTREEVLLKLGEPDFAKRKGQIFVYYWEMIAGYWGLFGGYTGVIGAIPRKHLFGVEFDESGIVKGYKAIDGVFLSSNELDPW